MKYTIEKGVVITPQMKGLKNSIKGAAKGESRFAPLLSMEVMDSVLFPNLRESHCFYNYVKNQGLKWVITRRNTEDGQTRMWRIG